MAPDYEEEHVSSPLSKLFGKSPFASIQQHMRLVSQCVEKVPFLFEHLRNNDDAQLAKVAAEIDDLESQADDVEADLRLHLPKSFFLPVDRRDILGILESQDAIANVAQDIAGNLTLRSMPFPSAIAEPIEILLESVMNVCRQCVTMVEEFDELIETGFGGRERDSVETMVAELNRLESLSDQKLVNALKALFAAEKTIDPVSVMMWYELIGWLGDLADHAERAGDRLRLMLAK
ncbi:MAG: TIGR00153 family protein [Acidobacteria bacterium]|nr:TIGR00153 family protein [Acidobacteriota bacterium]